MDLIPIDLAPIIELWHPLDEQVRESYEQRIMHILIQEKSIQSVREFLKSVESEQYISLAGCIWWKKGEKKYTNTVLKNSLFCF